MQQTHISSQHTPQHMSDEHRQKPKMDKIEEGEDEKQKDQRHGKLDLLETQPKHTSMVYELLPGGVW